MSANKPTPDSNVASWFEHQARVAPNSVAVVADDATTSYRELADEMYLVDAFLRARGIEAEQPVAVYMRRSARMIAVLLGILRAGGAYVPLDSDDPPERNQRILRQSGARFVFASKEFLDVGRNGLAEAVANSVEFVDAENLETVQPEAASPPPEPGGSRLAYLMFTSGSTGEPKGVAVEHRSVVNLLCAARDLIDFTSRDRFLAASTIGFDISVAELFLPLITGGSLLLRDRSIWLDPLRLAGDVRRHGVTVLQTGPSIWSVILANVPDFPRLRVAISTAEAISPELARKLAEYGEHVWNLYGPTEATIWATAHRLTLDAVPARESAISAPIGHPFAGTKVLLLDEAGHEVQAGEVGELCLGGPCLARGYYNNDTLTRESFITRGPNSDRYYRTGDLATKNADGTLEYLGRNDDQLNIRGVRLEPREVEGTIRQHPNVADAAATWYVSPDDSRALMAAIVLRPDEEMVASEMVEWLGPRLSRQKIPSRFVFCESLPLSPAGKVDRNAIRLLETSVLAFAEGPAEGPPLSPTEATLSGIWRRLLKLDAVSPDDHFFSIGGDSLAAVRMVLEAEAALQVEFTVQNVFESPTLGQLAARLDKRMGDEDDTQNIRYILPLSQTSPGRPLFFHTVDLKLASRNLWRVPCPLYSISVWAPGSGFLKADTVEELATVQLAGIRSIQPVGPYRLAGYSFGGIVALEIAQQIRAAGDEVDFLFLLDPMLPLPVSEAPTDFGSRVRDPVVETLGQRTRRHVKALVTKPRSAPAYAADKIFGYAQRYPLVQWTIYRIVHLHGRNPNPVSQWLLPKNRWPAFWYSVRRMAKDYLAKPFAGRVLAVFPDRGKPYTYWNELLDKKADTFVVASDSHSTLFDEPTMTEWMELLTRFMGNKPGDVPDETRERGDRWLA